MMALGLQTFGSQPPTIYLVAMPSRQAEAVNETAAFPSALPWPAWRLPYSRLRTASCPTQAAPAAPAAWPAWLAGAVGRVKAAALPASPDALR